MPTINLTNNADLDLTASSDDKNATLNRYLKSVLTFRTRPDFDRIIDQPFNAVDPAPFPVSLTATGTANFAVEKTTLTVQPQVSATLGLLKDEAKFNFLQLLRLPDDFAPDRLLCFGVTGSLTAGPAATVGDFSFGVTTGESVTLTSYYPATATDTVRTAATNAITRLTIPHDRDDLTALPLESVCQLDLSSTLQFTASASYSFLNNPLASLPIQNLPQISVTASSGVTVESTVTHTGDHTLTLAKLADGTLHLSVSLTKTDDFETSLTVSAGLTADLGNFDALAFLLNRFSLNAALEMQKIREELPDKGKQLSGDIRTAIDGALSTALQASIKAALDLTGSSQRLFLYKIVLKDLDATSEAALASALHGDFTELTRPGASLRGIAELDSALTLSKGATQSLGIHLLGLFNFSSVHQFVESATVDFTDDKHDLVLADERTYVKTDSLKQEKLRQIVLKNVALTLPASANTPESDTSLAISFFDREAAINTSKLRQFVNALQAIRSADAGAAASAADGGKSARACSLYLGLELSAGQCRKLYIGGNGKALAWTFYLKHLCSAEVMLLDGDPQSANRRQLFGIEDVAIWDQLADAGTLQKTVSVLRNNGFGQAPLIEALVTDVFTAVWWSKAMANYAIALHDGKSLADVGRQVVKNDTLGFNEPWLVLAAWNILGQKPAINSKFTFSTLRPPVPSLGAGR
jgi:hypothetical protein